MESYILSGESESTLKLIIQIAKKLGVKAIPLSKEKKEDFLLGILMDKEKTNQLVDEDVIINELKK